MVSDEGEVRIPAERLGSLARPGTHLRVHVERAPSRHSMLGRFAGPGAPKLALDDFVALSDEIWADTPYRH